MPGYASLSITATLAAAPHCTFCMNPVFPYIAAFLTSHSVPLCDSRLLPSLPSLPSSSLLSPPSCSDNTTAAPAFPLRLPSLPPSSSSSATPPSDDDVPPPASLSSSSPQSIADAATSSPPPSSSSKPHSIDWHEVSLPRFILWMSLFSIAENALFYPFYLLKTREQADRSANYNALESASRHLRGALAKGGIRGVYKGFVSSSVVTLPAYGVYSGVYTWAKEQIGLTHNSTTSPDSFAARHPVLLSYAAPFVAGLVADIASISLYVPGDVIVQRLQLPNSPYTSFVDATVKIYQREGVAGFYRGFGATFVTSAIASAVWWLAYEKSKERLYSWDERRRQGKEQTAKVEHRPGSLWAALTEVNRTPQLAAGFIAGTVTSSLINPLDVVKTRLQVQDSTHPASGGKAAKGRYRNFLHGLRQVYVEEGMRGYVRGLVPKLVSRGPLSAMSSLMYELVLYLSRNEQATGSAASSGPKVAV